MAYRISWALVGPICVAVVMLAANESFARSGVAAARAGSAPPHSFARPGFAGHFRRNHPGTFWPATGGFFYGPSGGEPMPEVNQSISGDIRYTYSYDVPWDWAHRYPPAVALSDRPYVSNCPVESVIVPGRSGRESTVNVIRCY